MKLAVGYFYQVRFFKSYMIPVSIAISDPSWFHGNKGKTYTFFDKNNVINGLRCEEFSPGPLCTGLCHGKEGCSAEGPESCDFLKMYSLQLAGTIDLEAFMRRCESAVAYTKSRTGFTEEPVIVLLVHEAPDNPCSERVPIMKFFESKGIECPELRF